MTATEKIVDLFEEAMSMLDNRIPFDRERWQEMIDILSTTKLVKLNVDGNIGNLRVFLYNAGVKLLDISGSDSSDEKSDEENSLALKAKLDSKEENAFLDEEGDEEDGKDGANQEEG